MNYEDFEGVLIGNLRHVHVMDKKPGTSRSPLLRSLARNKKKEFMYKLNKFSERAKE
jgi:hypothetical protein